MWRVPVLCTGCQWFNLVLPKRLMEQSALFWCNESLTVLTLSPCQVLSFLLKFSSHIYLWFGIVSSIQKTLSIFFLLLQFLIKTKTRHPQSLSVGVDHCFTNEVLTCWNAALLLSSVLCRVFFVYLMHF